MASRSGVRARIVAHALVQRALAGPRIRAEHPRRILVVHQLLLGDTIMLTPLLAKLRERFPESHIAMALPAAFAPLYGANPYGVLPLPFSPRDPASYAALRREAGFDIVIVPGDNRFSWLAQALGARWIVAFSGDRPAYKNWLVDEAIPYPEHPAAWGDMVAGLISGPPSRPFQQGDWPDPVADAIDIPRTGYCVLHVGASSPRKLWPASNWLKLAHLLRVQGLEVIWSAGRGEEHLVEAADPKQEFKSQAGQLGLAQLWHLLKGAALLVAPDTGIAHLGKATLTPTVALIGAGPSWLYGKGDFWRSVPFRQVVLADLPPRRQTSLFRRELPWLEGLAAGPDDRDIVRGAGFDIVAETALAMLESGVNPAPPV